MQVLLPDEEDLDEIATPPQNLTIGKVLDTLTKAKNGNFVTFKNVPPKYNCSVNTPNINTLLALPYKKRPVGSSQAFRGVWSAKKEYVRGVSGKGGEYQVNKSRRRSETFPWPESSSQESGKKYVQL